MTRRAAGDGTLFKRSDGLWVGGVELPPGPNGKRRLKRVTSKNRNTVLAKLRQLRGEVAAGDIATGPSMTVEKWFTYWLTNIVPHTKTRPSTRKQYADTVRLYILPTLGHKRLDKLAAGDIRDLYTHLQNTVSTRAALKAHRAMNLAIKAALRDDVVTRNIMDKVDTPVHAPAAQFAFDLKGAQHIIDTAIEHQGAMWGARWAMGFVTGARESEILGLEWDRIDLDKGVVDISWQLLRMQKEHGCGDPVDGAYPCGMQRMSFCPQAHWDFPPGMPWRECDGTMVWTPPKTKAGTRLIPLVPEAVAVLRELKREVGPNPHNLVFHHPDGRPFTQEQDQKMWRDLLKVADVPHVRQHSIRHSTATILLEAGVDAHIIQTIIGHTDIVTTRAYQHVSMELARTAWNNLSGILSTEHNTVMLG